MGVLLQSLNGAWQWRAEDEAILHPGHVPGSVLQDMLAEGLIEDPFWRDNEYKTRDLFRKDYLYRKTFEVSDELLACDEIDLVFEGLDTLARVFVNGIPAAETDNMHRIWTIPVKRLLKVGKNELEVRLLSPLRFIRQADEESDITYFCTGSMPGSGALRKAHYMFGWDWGPQLPDAGIFRPVTLRGTAGGRIESIRTRQRHENGRVTLEAEAALFWTKENCSGVLRWTLQGPDGFEQQAETPVRAGQTELPRIAFLIEYPALWWPNGWGNQPLYTLKAELAEQNGVPSDQKTLRLGLRTLRLHTEDDAWGSRFFFEVNGKSIFAMGANYIPQDNLPGRVSPERTERLIRDCAEAHFNMLRVWGGGYYQDDAFYDACDRYGILVWHDLMFACNVYALDEEGKFERSVVAETRENVRRLRHHPCLALWCGNNEMEAAWANWGELQRQPRKYLRDYLILFERVLKQTVEEEDGVTPWRSSSPSSGGALDEPDSPDRGDQHYWEVWHSSKPFTAYRERHFRFCSEFGFQSFPAMKTIRAFTLPGDRNIFHPVMESHQKNGAANSKIFAYVADYFRYPKNMDAVSYVSQLLQLKAIQYGVEFWRQNRGRCMGSLYWQLNDCWPVASWSSIDYFGRWKALHYGARRFYAPRMASCREKEELSADLTWFVHNDSLEAYTGKLAVDLRRDDFTLLAHLETDVSVPPLTAMPALHADFAPLLSTQDERRHAFAEYRLTVDGGVISRGTTLFVKPKHLDLPAVTYHVEVTEEADVFRILVRSDCFSYYTELDFDAWDAVFSDNYFDITQPQGVTVTVPKAAFPAGMKAEDIRQALRIRSVRDSYLPEEP